MTRGFVTYSVAMRETEVPEVVALWKAFGERIRARREELGWSQDAAGEKVGMTRQQWNRIEAGIGTKRSTVYRIASSLQLPAIVVLDWAGYKVPDVPPANDESRLSYFYREMPDEDRARLLAIAETLWQRTNGIALPLPTEHLPQAADGFLNLDPLKDDVGGHRHDELEQDARLALQTKAKALKKK